MNIEKLREVIRKYEGNYDYFNDQAHDEIFKSKRRNDDAQKKK